jgi:hypothetical protein
MAPAVEKKLKRQLPASVDQIFGKRPGKRGEAGREGLFLTILFKQYETLN